MGSRKRKNNQNIQESKELIDNKENDDGTCVNNLRFGPMPTFPNQKRFTRHIIIISMMVIVYFYSKKDKERVLASSNMKVPQRTMPVTCSTMFSDEVEKFRECVPRSCGRGAYDKLVTDGEADLLFRLAEKGFAHSDPAGGAAILDLHSGALSHKENFINIYKITDGLFDQSDFDVYKAVKQKIQQAVANQFMIETNSLHLAHPTFFSRLTAIPARTIHDEYWHTHVDKETYKSFHYTALLYLSTYKEDFEGGRFIFVEADNSSWSVEPVRGRVLLFTSGAENVHRVERVKSGVRTALTIAFTCNPAQAISDPALPAP